MFVMCLFPIAGAAAGAAPPLLQAKASASFLLAALNKVTEAVRARLAAISCCRMMVSFNASSARFLRASPMQSMVDAAVGITACAPPWGLPPPKAWSCWHWCFRWARWNGTFQACHIRDAARRPSQSSTSHGKCWAARTATDDIMMSSSLAIGMRARIAFFWASSIMTMNWGIPFACK